MVFGVAKGVLFIEVSSFQGVLIRGILVFRAFYEFKLWHVDMLIVELHTIHFLLFINNIWSDKDRMIYEHWNLSNLGTEGSVLISEVS